MVLEADNHAALGAKAALVRESMASTATAAPGPTLSWLESGARRPPHLFQALATWRSVPLACALSTMSLSFGGAKVTPAGESPPAALAVAPRPSLRQPPSRSAVR
jgi:hypothetical protein